ncbi:LptF/LptG family permease [Flavobacterium sp. '19STA2R22 D10 B1']|uniref:LptF/LptG family permease n=1 Tax=Flavobacterium aerium TaxID=3037261 RepID=UPI00278C5731|nr:LptF/LptG family permease [Flavobacterium sp. '19STA2R22 D10 B1']
MKILDRYILKTYLITFTSVFVILFFIFILQTVWLFIAELAGKDLDFILIIKFLLFASPKLFPLVLPLTVLLASIMTFGDLAENYEFAAMKSSGISLQRAMKSLIVFILFLSVAAFVFANNVIPYAEYKFINFRKNIAQVKPAMAIAEGQFNDLGIYNIKVNKKSGENGEKLAGITIHKKTGLGGNTTVVIKAKDGELISSEKSNILQMVLNDGYYYDDIVPKKYEDRQKFPFAKSSFKKYIININLTELNPVDVDEEKVANTNNMLNVTELRYTLDSLNTSYKKDLMSFTDNIYQRTGIAYFPLNPALANKDTVINNLLPLYTRDEQTRILEIASSNIISSQFNIDNIKIGLEGQLKNINNHWLALNEKFVIAYACILMFFIGAPLGSIIRKGGLGLPIVFAVLIFITFHFINTFGRKVAQENELSPFLGSWMSSMLLTPFAILLIHRATNDIGLINMDVITLPIQKLFNKIFKSKKN